MAQTHQTTAGYNVTVGSTTFKQQQPNGMLQLVVEDHVDMSSVCQITVSTAEAQPTGSYGIGDKVSVKLTSEESIFDGEVVSIRHSFQAQGTSSIVLEAIDHIHRLGRGRKTRFWNDMTDSDVVKEVAAEAQLEVDAEGTTETHSYILQRNESNVAFLKRLAARNDFQLRVEPGKILFKTAETGGQTTQIAAGAGLISMSVNYNSAELVQEVVVRGWDIKTKKEIVGKATAADVAAIGQGGKGGEHASVFGEATAYITDIPISSQSAADQVAKAEMERIARRFCKGKCSIIGDDSVRAGTVIEFSNIGSSLGGKFYVISTRHMIAPSSGYRTEVSFCSNSDGS